MCRVQAAEKEASRATRLLQQLQPHWMARAFRIMLALELQEMDTALHGVKVTWPCAPLCAGFAVLASSMRRSRGGAQTCSSATQCEVTVLMAPPQPP